MCVASGIVRTLSTDETFIQYAVRILPATTGFKPRRQPHQVDVVVVTSHARLSMNHEFISEETPAPAYQDSVRMRPRNSPK
jgi:hypothetical protein